MIIPCPVGHWQFRSGDQLTLVAVQPDGVIGVDIACTRTARPLRLSQAWLTMTSRAQL